MTAWRLLGVSLLLLAGGLAAPAKASEDVLDGLGFERTLGDRQLLRTWHRQKALTHAPAKIPTHGRRVAPRNRRITEQPEPLAAPASIGPVSVATAARRDRYAPIIDAEAARQGVDPNLVHAVIRAESAYRPSAKSHAGAYGLMQLMPATAKRFGVRDIWDPAQNIRGGVAYLRFLVDRFDGDIHLVLAAYNAGEGAVEKHGNRIPPYRETRAYVRRVLEYLGAA